MKTFTPQRYYTTPRRFVHTIFATFDVVNVLNGVVITVFDTAIPGKLCGATTFDIDAWES